MNCNSNAGPYRGGADCVCSKASPAQDCYTALKRLLPGLQQTDKTPLRNYTCTECYAPNAWAAFSSEGQILLEALLSCMTTYGVGLALLGQTQYYYTQD